MIFKGDAAFVCFVADVDSNTPNGSFQRALRICDFYTKNAGKWIQSGSYTASHPDTVQQQLSTPAPLGDQMKKRLLDAREAVWRAWFTGDRATLEKLIPAEAIALDSQDSNWDNRRTILDGSVAFVQTGAKLVRLEFPKTEIQMYGVTAIVYSDYVFELEQSGTHSTHTGRATEVFVLRNGQWLNPGWLMDSGK